MLPLRIAGNTRAVGKNQPEYRTIYIRDFENEGMPYMASSWELTPDEEMAATADGGGFCVWVKTATDDQVALMRPVTDEEKRLISAGCAVTLVIDGSNHPPISPTVVPDVSNYAPARRGMDVFVNPLMADAL